ncbi:reverse transcriptase domain-containing protein, partial [Tanacetum coccineum]
WILLDDRNEASKLRIKARQYELLEGVLYRWSFLKLWLRTTVRGGQIHAARILLANHASGYTGYDTQMDQEKSSFNSRYGLFYEVDRGESRGDNHRQSGEEVRVGQHSVSLRPPRRNIKHPHSNGIVEKVNRTLGEGIKARLGEGNKNSIKEIPHVLWAHRTIIKSSHGDTPFSLTYGTEAVIRAEIRMPTYCTAVVDAVHNDEELRINLDLLEERCERAAIREAKANLKMTKYYIARVRGVTFRPEDFVYCSNDAIHVVDGGKLGPK